MSTVQKALDEYEAKPVQELMHNAQQLVTKLCERGPREWVMSIPVRPDDSDIILSTALTKAAGRIADLQRQNALLRAVAEAAITHDVALEAGTATTETQSAILNALQAAIDGGALGEGEA